MTALAHTTPEDACGAGGMFYSVMIADEFGGASWFGTFDDFNGAVREADNHAQIHKTMCWISPAIYKIDARPNE